MALVESVRIALGTKMPSFDLVDPFGKHVTLEDVMGPKGLLVVFTCNHCPYALAIWDRVIALSVEAKGLGIHTVAINPNIHPNYPDDAPDKMKAMIARLSIPFPYLVDENQDIAKAYKAQCTPDLYLLKSNQTLAYHGRLDDNWKVPSQVKNEDLKLAIIAMAKDEGIDSYQYPSMGCSIKWKD